MFKWIAKLLFGSGKKTSPVINPLGGVGKPCGLKEAIRLVLFENKKMRYVEWPKGKYVAKAHPTADDPKPWIKLVEPSGAISVYLPTLPEEIGQGWTIIE
jgi:hypothetical protein